MLVLVAVASITVETASTLAFQGRYEVTKDRYEKIKKAIIGDPNQIVNGQPDISGFVADMGRTPDNLRELLQRYVCDTPAGASPANCITPNANPWVDASNYALDPTTNLKFGWNGPYLQTSHAATDDRALIDGWANSPSTPNDWNYGWVVTPALNLGNNFTLKSKGKDQAINVNGCLNYEDDCEYVLSGE